MTKLNPQEVHNEAHAKGMEAGNAKVPTPMIVGNPKGGLFGTDIDYEQKTYYVPRGVCGFAWVKIRPARGKLVTYLKKAGIGGKAYGGGYQIWVNQFGQSMEQKEAYAIAYAEVLKEHGVNAYAASRMD